MNLGIDYLLNNFIWMGWNVLLAFVPYALAVRLYRKNVRRTRLWWIGIGLFLLFLPNTAYIITDVVHFEKPLKYFPDPIILTLAAVQFLALELAGYWLFVESYRKFERYILKRKDLDAGTVRIFMFLLISVGVFVGRFVRLNSWDLLIAPASVVAVVPSLIKLSALFFIAIFTVLLLLIYSIHDLFIAEK